MSGLTSLEPSLRRSLGDPQGAHLRLNHAFPHPDPHRCSWPSSPCSVRCCSSSPPPAAPAQPRRPARSAVASTARRAPTPEGRDAVVHRRTGPTSARRKQSATGSYSLSLKPGTYRLQFVDQRPAYDLDQVRPRRHHGHRSGPGEPDQERADAPGRRDHRHRPGRRQGRQGRPGRRGEHGRAVVRGQGQQQGPVRDRRAARRQATPSSPTTAPSGTSARACGCRGSRPAGARTSGSA